MNNQTTKNCKKCGEQINIKAQKCPHCKASQGTPTWLIVILVILGIFMFYGVISSGGNTDSDSTSSSGNKVESKPKEYIAVTKDELDEALENNAAAAKDKYNGKYLEISGKLGTIDSDLKYISLMSSTDEWDFLGIYCYIKNKDQKEVVKSLTKDQNIIVKGKITDVGEVLGYYLDIDEIIPQ